MHQRSRGGIIHLTHLETVSISTATVTVYHKPCCSVHPHFMNSYTSSHQVNQCHTLLMALVAVYYNCECALSLQHS